MGVQRPVTVLNRLLGKKVLFQGKFAYGEQERLSAMAEAQQGLIAEDLDKSVDYLVLADLSAGKTVQKKALSLNAKGASVQVIDGDAFRRMVEPTAAEVLALIRGGAGCAPILAKAIGGDHMVLMPIPSLTAGGTAFTMGHGRQVATLAGEDFASLDLSGFDLRRFDFDQCDFRGSTVTGACFGAAKGCDFGDCTGEGLTLESAEGSRFGGAKVAKARIAGFSGADFTSATIEHSQFVDERFLFGPRTRTALAGCRFANGVLRHCEFCDIQLRDPIFDGADLSDSRFSRCELTKASFRNAKLQNASLVECKLTGADFTGAKLCGANLAGADLTDCRLDGADLAGCNLRGAKLDGVDLSKAKNYDPNAIPAGTVGPALTELDSIQNVARRIEITFHVRNGQDDDGDEVGLDTSSLQHGWGLRVPPSIGGGYYRAQSGKAISDAMLQLANLLGGRKVRYETVEIQSTKSPKGGKELRELVIKGIAEAFAQPLPPEEELASATRLYRDAAREQGAADRERREKAKADEEKRKAAEKKQITRKIAKAVGKVTDIATFLKAMELRAEKPKIQKATSMLKASGLQLFNDISDECLSGVVKSQTDPDLVYACRIDHDGAYACCTQNLNICGGLRGSICKHLLVLIIGLVKAGELDPATIDAWVAKTHNAKPELDKEQMAPIFLKYKGAEAGEVDWRPTETLPEDYYAL